MNHIALLLRREFSFSPRRRWFHAQRLLAVGVAGFLLLVTFASEVVGQSSQAGLVLFRYLLLAVVVAVLWVSPYVAAAAVVQEKEQRTLELLFLGGFSRPQFLLAQLASASGRAVLGLLSVLPLFLLCIGLGGVANEQILMAGAVLASSLLMGAALGLLVAGWVTHEGQLPRAVLATVLVAQVAVPGLLVLTAQALGAAPAEALAVVSPLGACWSVIEGQDLRHPAGLIALNVAVTPLLLAAAWWLLARWGRGGDAARRGPATILQAELTDLLTRSPRHYAPPRNRHNPVLWKDLYIGYGGEQRAWRSFLLGGLVVWLLATLGYVLYSLLQGRGRADEWLLLLAGSLAAFSALGLLVGVVGRAARALGSERRQRTLDLLLSSDLTEEQIISGKTVALALAGLPWLIGLAIGILSYTFLGLVTAQVDLQTTVLLVLALVNGAGMLYAYVHLVMAWSLVGRERGTAWGITGFVLWFILGNALLILLGLVLAPLSGMVSAVALPLAGPWLIGWQARGYLVSQCRRATQSPAV